MQTFITQQHRQLSTMSRIYTTQQQATTIQSPITWQYTTTQQCLIMSHYPITLLRSIPTQHHITIPDYPTIQTTHDQLLQPQLQPTKMVDTRIKNNIRPMGITKSYWQILGKISKDFSMWCREIWPASSRTTYEWYWRQCFQNLERSENGITFGG